jgi:hypothetical protein
MGELRSHMQGRVLLIVGGASIHVLLFSVAAGEAYTRHGERSQSTVPGTMPLLSCRHVRLRHALRRFRCRLASASLGAGLTSVDRSGRQRG